MQYLVGLYSVLNVAMMVDRFVEFLYAHCRLLIRSMVARLAICGIVSMLWLLLQIVSNYPIYCNIIMSVLSCYYYGKMAASDYTYNHKITEKHKKHSEN